MVTEAVISINDLSTALESNISVASSRKIDFGVYRCIAVNDVGNVTSSTLLNVLCKYNAG